jgi:hypothetical protein
VIWIKKKRICQQRSLMMKLTFWGVLALSAFFMLMDPCMSQAARKPAVISHDATYVNRTVRFHIVWQAENPVVTVKIFAGREHKEIKIDEYDNKRTRDGYSGEVSALVEIDPSFTETSLAYVIQLEDDVRLKSDPVHSKILIVKSQPQNQYSGQQQGGMMPQQGQPMPPPGGGGFMPNTGAVMQQYDAQGQPAGQQPPAAGGTATNLINAVAGVIAAVDLQPNVSPVTVQKTGVDGVAFAMQVNDDKGLSSITIKIFDHLGNLVQQDIFSPTGKNWQGSSKVFNLTNGNYKVVIQATDSAGNFSAEKTEFFSITGAPAMPAQEAPYSSMPPPLPQPATPDMTAPAEPPVMPAAQLPYGKPNP